MMYGYDERVGGDYQRGPFEGGWGPDENYGDTGEEQMVLPWLATYNVRVRITRLE
jgi:hypothetical protein